MLYLIYQNREFKSQIEYLFQVMLTAYGVEGRATAADAVRDLETKPSDIVISYGKERPDHPFKHHIPIYEANLFGKSYLDIGSMPELPLNRFLDMPVLYVGDGDISDYVVTKQTKSGNRTIETRIDIIASSFFMLSRYEEIVSAKRDQYNRFPAEESIAYKEGFLDRPVVNEYLELLWTWIDSFGLEITRKPLWPYGKDFAVCLTHDVDHVTKWAEDRRYARLVLRTEPLEAAKKWLSSIGSMLKRDNPYWNFEQIVEREKGHGFNSSFYFLAGKHHPRDGSYNINNGRVKALIKWLESEGVEIGLHGSFNSNNDAALLSDELATLTSIAKEVRGVRQHYLRLNTGSTFAAQDKVKLNYDTTLGFAGHEGYRSGFGLPYHPYNFEDNRAFELLEIPLTIMDGTLCNPQYRNMTPEAAWSTVENILDTTKRFNSCATLLWHNTSFDEHGFPGMGDIYWRALAWIRDNNGWGASGREIYEWWTGR